MADIILSSGDYAKAELLYRDMIALQRDESHPLHGHLARTARGLAGVLLSQDKATEAETYFTEAEEHLLAAYRESNDLPEERNAQTPKLITDLIDLYETWGKPDQAAEYRALLPKSEQAEPARP